MKIAKPVKSTKPRYSHMFKAYLDREEARSVESPEEIYDPYLMDKMINDDGDDHIATWYARNASHDLRGNSSWGAVVEGKIFKQKGKKR